MVLDRTRDGSPAAACTPGTFGSLPQRCGSQYGKDVHTTADLALFPHLTLRYNSFKDGIPCNSAVLKLST